MNDRSRREKIKTFFRDKKFLYGRKWKRHWKPRLKMFFRKWYVRILLVLALIYAASSIYSRITRPTSADFAKGGYEVDAEEEFIAELKATPSDIEGMSRFDKYEMGLDYRDGSDTDRDGLSDKEEIETYQSDPLKASTAGDLYTDGYKVSNGLDVNEKYEYQEEISFENNECSNVMLNADTPTDLRAVVKDVTDAHELDAFGMKEVYAGYYIYNYGGKVQIDTASVADKKDLKVMVSEGDFIADGITEFEKTDYDTNGSVITVNKELEDDKSYYIYLADSHRALLNSIFKGKEKEELEEDGAALMIGFPLEPLFSENAGHVTISEMATEESTAEMAKRTANYYNKWLGDSYTVDAASLGSDNLKTANYDSVKRKYQILHTLLPIFEMKPDSKDTLPQILFFYSYYEDTGTVLGSTTIAGDNDDASKPASEESGHSSDGKFDKYTDELPFANFSSEYSGGNCAGITHLTAYLYNTSGFPASGGYEFSKGDSPVSVEWDLTTDDSNATLMDKGLYDYKDSSFVDKTGELREDLTEGEKQFVDMMGCLWREANDNDSTLDNRVSGGTEYDFSVIEKTMDYIDQGKIVDAGMLLKDGSGHAVNLYDYFISGSGEIIFKVYDSNIPQDKRKGYTLRYNTCYLQVREKINADGTHTFSYLYLPLKDDVMYMASSEKSLMGTHALKICDENWNVFQ